MQSVSNALDTVSRAVARGTTVLCLVVLYVMLTLLAIQIVMRYFFGAPPSWTEELAIGLFAWLVLLFASVGVRECFHVAVDWLDAYEAPAFRRNADRFVLVLTIVFGAILAWSGYLYVERTVGQLSAALQYPIELLHLAAPLSGILIILHALARFVKPDRDRLGHG